MFILINVLFNKKSDIRECLLSADGVGYGGTENTTQGGYTCQAWSSQTPHRHNFTDLGTEANFCRNSDGSRLPWCFTTDPKTLYDYCDIGLCGKSIFNKMVHVIPPFLHGYHDNRMPIVMNMVHLGSYL